LIAKQQIKPPKDDIFQNQHPIFPPSHAAIATTAHLIN